MQRRVLGGLIFGVVALSLACASKRAPDCTALTRALSAGRAAATAKDADDAALARARASAAEKLAEDLAKLNLATAEVRHLRDDEVTAARNVATRSRTLAEALDEVTAIAARIDAQTKNRAPADGVESQATALASQCAFHATAECRAVATKLAEIAKAATDPDRLDALGAELRAMTLTDAALRASVNGLAGAIATSSAALREAARARDAVKAVSKTMAHAEAELGTAMAEEESAAAGIAGACGG